MNWLLKLIALTFIFSSYSFSTFITAEVKKLPEKRLAVVITTYNNEKYCGKNLELLFAQNYNNYYVVIIDDCSTDKTYEKIKKFISFFNQEDRVKIIRNTNRKGKAANLYNAIHNYCDDNDIIVEYDGDDWFSHNEVFNYINSSYTKENVWLTYGGYQEYPSGRKNVCKSVPIDAITNNNFRRHYGHVSQLRTFYAWLFKAIKLEDFLYEGKFMKMTSDVAQMLPMFEMSGERIKLNPTVYIYNRTNTINDDKVDAKLQIKIDKYIRSRPKYKRLVTPITKQHKSLVKTEEVDAFILSSSSDINNLDNFLFSLKKLNSINNVYIIVPSNNINILSLQSHIDNQNYPFKANIIQLPSSSHFKTQLVSLINRSSNKSYILIANESDTICAHGNISDFINVLEKTQAYAFHLSMQSAIISEKIEDNIYALQYKFNFNSKNPPHSLGAMLLVKENVLKAIKNLSFIDLNMFKKAWNNYNINLLKIGLYAKN